MKKILELVTYIDSGGAEMVIFNYLSHMNRNECKFDVLALEQDHKPFLEEKFRNLGVGVYYLPKKISKRFGTFRKLVKDNGYDVVHCHSEFLSEIYLGIAALNGVKVRVMHSHMAGGHYTMAKSLYAPIGRFIAKFTATNFFGCGIDACKCLWGEKAYNSGKCYVLNNAIDTERFRYSEKTRNSVRQKMHWENKRVVLNVGRFEEQKNHRFLVKMWSEYVKKYPDSLLVLIGIGPLESEIKDLVKRLNIDDSVQFLERRNDVHEILNAADVFCLPSLFEGLPVVSIETQANGLPIVMSDCVTRECGITELASFVSLKAPLIDWIDALNKPTKVSREAFASIVAKANYDIIEEADKLRNFYLQG